MSLGIAFKGAEGIVLAADSRVTLTAVTMVQGPAGTPMQSMISSTFDNATKLLSVKSQPFVGAVTYGAGAIGQQAPRTASSFLPEFDEELKEAAGGKNTRLSVQAFAEKLSEFFLRQWIQQGMPNPAPPNSDMVFMVGGFDEKAAYGRIFQLQIPGTPTPVEISAGDTFGAVWGGQSEIADRLLVGFDRRLPDMAQELLNIPKDKRQKDLEAKLKQRLTVPIPWQFLPLQDCVDLSIFVVRSTILLQQWLVGIRGVGGAVDVATITRTEGFKEIQVKQVTGDKASMHRRRED